MSLCKIYSFIILDIIFGSLTRIVCPSDCHEVSRYVTTAASSRLMGALVLRGFIVIQAPRCSLSPLLRFTSLDFTGVERVAPTIHSRGARLGCLSTESFGAGAYSIPIFVSCPRAPPCSSDTVVVCRVFKAHAHKRVRRANIVLRTGTNRPR